jgi:hypothetical protein
LFVLSALLTVPAVLTRSDVGLIWSARHFMFLMPALVILSGKSLKNFTAFSGRKNLILPSLLAAFAILQQLTGIYSLYAVSNECRSLENTVRQMQTAVIASDVFYLPEMTPRLWFECDFYDLSAPEKIEKLLQQLPEELVLILSPQPQFRRIADSNLNYLLKFYNIPKPPVHFKQARGSGFIDLFILKIEKKKSIK